MEQSQRKDADEMMQPELEGLVGYNLKRAYMIMQSDFRTVMADKAMSPRVFSALSLIVQLPNLTQSDLSRHLGIERSGLVAIVDELEGKGHVRRVAVPSDRRVQALCPTPKGVAAYHEAANLVRTHEDRLLSVLTDAEREQLIVLLQKIRQCEEEGAQ